MNRAVTIVVVLVVAVARAAAFSFGGELDPNSRYVWRGAALSSGPVAQPSVWFSLGDFTFTPWANFALGAEDNQWKFNEVDLALSYEREWQGFNLSPSLACYLYPNQDDAPATVELGLELGRPVGPIEVSTSHAVDLLADRGAYYGTAGLGYEHELLSELSAGLSVEAGWGSARFNEANFEVARTALNLVGAEASVEWSPGGLFYLRPHAGLSVLVDSELSEAAGNRTLVWAGLAIGKEF